MKKYAFIAVLMIVAMVLPAAQCPGMEPAKGTEGNPITMYFVPSAEADKVLASGEIIAKALEERTGYKFETAVPTSYAAVIEAMGTDKADIAWLATFAYIVAHDKYGVDVSLTTVRYGADTYKGQFIAKADSGLTKIEDIAGKKIAYTDAGSTSGFIYPSALLAKMGIVPGETLFAGGHPQAALAVKQGSADVGCTYWSDRYPDGTIGDARRTLATIDAKADPEGFAKELEAIEKEIVIIGFTDDIPNDTVSFRKDFPADMRAKIVQAIMDYAQTDEGKQALADLYNITGFTASNDARYDVVREALKAMGKSAEEYMPE
ncbi:MAG: phosphate/phosphite/phosphonate ABC transporter substrate-binding protein [Chloroflexi bacterium]|nr:phosphate/phosphite/phosphonate ABC transporter substrate-binding protein [Chloroflexota bacterium]MBU1748546.1 phosphate/phosphite/phosphonate ABC transporter substrate-binding protein [Chloroflexota bacterium]